MDQAESMVRAERKPFACDGAESLLLPFAFGMGYLFIRFLLNVGSGLAVVFFMTGVYVTTAVYMRTAKIKPVWSGVTLAWTALTALLTIPFALFDGRDGRMLPVLLCLMCAAAVQLYSMLGCRTRGFTEEAYLDWANAVVVTPFTNLGASWQTVGAVVKRGKGRTALGAFVGFLIGLPVLVVLTLLLSSADTAFEGFLNRFSIDFIYQIDNEIGRLIGGIPFAMMAFGILYGCRRKKSIAKVKAPGVDKTRRIPASAAYGVLIPIVLLYVVYLVTQMAYFFSGFAGLLPTGYTYAEYARRGFFELCMVCVINLGIIVLILAFMKLKSGIGKGFCTFFAMFSLVLTGTAVSKMVLYVNTYGLTPLRAQTMWFMLALGVTFVYILARLYIRRFPFVRTLAVTAAAMLLVFAYTDADAMSVSYNLRAIEEGRIAEDRPGMTFAGFSGTELSQMSDGIEPYLREHTANPLADAMITSRKESESAYRESILYWNLATERAKG